MEVTLSDTIGLPQGTLLSIRVGSTRRQAVVDSKFKLVFPKGCKHGEDVKVDALQQIGSNMMKYNESVGRYDLDLDDFGSKVSLHMREVIQPATEQEVSAAPEAAKVDDSSVSHRHRVAVYARKYLDEHKLLTWAHKLFQDLIHDQPADPWGYIDKRSAEARGEAELAAKAEAERKLAQADMEDIRQRTATQLQQAAEDGSLENALSHSQEAPELPPMSKELEEITDSQEVAHMKTEEEDLDNLRLKTQAALFRAAEDGSLQEVLGSKASQPAAAATAKDVDVLRLHAAQMLLSAAEDGSLEKALIDASKDTKDVDLLRQEAAATLLRAAEDGTLESVLSKNQAPKDDLESLRQEAAHTLLAAAQDGRLEDVLTKKSQETNIEAIRQEAAAALCKAMEEGSLEAALAQAKGQKDVDVHVLKQEAATALLQAAQDGSLEKAFAEVKSEPQQELESLRMAAAETLLKAAVDGSLEQALRAAPRSGASGITSAGTSELGDLATDLVHAACQAAETPQGPLSVVFSQEPVDEDSLSKATKPGDQGKDIEAIRQAAARSLLKAAEDGRLESALGAVTMPSQQGSKADLDQIRIKAAASLLRAAEDGRLAEVLAPTSKGTTDVEQIRLKAAASLLRAAEDGRLAEVLAPKSEKDVDTMRKEAAAALLSAAQDGRLEAALAKETVSEAPAGGPPPVPEIDEEVRELARKTFEEAAADGRLADALSKALAPEPAAPPQAAKTEEQELEDLRVQAKDTLLAACADGSLEAALQSKTQVAGLLAGWAADNCSTEQGQDVKAIKEKAADALVKALAMEDPEETTPEAAPLKAVPEPEAMAPPAPPPREDQAELNIQDVKARACDALHKALGLEDEQPVDLDDVKARAAGALEKALGVSESAATSKEETAEAEPAPAQPTLVSEVQEITRQVKEELGKFQGEVCGQLQDLKQLSSEVRKDVEDLRHQVAEAKREVSGSSTFGATTVTTIKPEDPLQDLAGGSLADLEKKIRERNERFRRENAAMREENARLKMMGPKAD